MAAMTEGLEFVLRTRGGVAPEAHVIWV